VAHEPRKDLHDEPPWNSLRGFLCRLFLRLGARSHDAEDLAQESLARVIGRAGGDRNPVSLGFAAAVGRNLWRDRLRARMRRAAPENLRDGDDVADLAASPAERATSNEDKERLGAALASLDPRHRDAIVLVILQGRSYAEAARMLDVPGGTLKSRIHYGIRRLRSRLADEPTDVPSERRIEEC
jgi:RNA polymerase sigma-70 factor (ECF subfamily)